MRRIILRLSLSVFFLITLQSFLHAQGVTSASMNGIIVDEKGEPLPGANVIATHEPTGSQYGATTDVNGLFYLNNVRVGGPYTVVASFVSYQTRTQANIYLKLGQNLKIDFKLSENTTELKDVEIIAQKDKIFDASRTGAATSVSQQQIATLPTLSRSINDFARLTPQFSAKDGGLSFAGQNNRFNNIMIDGAVNNDVFGLNSQGTPGGRTGAQPVSLDAIQELQVLLAPYDVRQSGFTGGGVNAITRSGTNKFEGSVYFFNRNQKLVGKKLGDSPVNVQDFNDTQTGFRLGGPILKNKLFFFVNGELGRRKAPNTFEVDAYAANGQTDPALISEKKAAILQELNDIRNVFVNQYNYDPGDPTVRNPLRTDNDKVFVRLDYNLNNKHTLTLRHNFINAYTQEVFRDFNNYSFSSGGISINNSTNSTVFELQSRFNNTMNNEFRVAYTRIKDIRNNNGPNFPRFAIGGTNIANINVGTDRDSGANSLFQDLIEITDNFTLRKGKHNITVGTRNEIYFFKNVFIQNVTGNWTFTNLDSVQTGKPVSYVKNYSRTDDPLQGAQWGAIQFGLYAQDEWSPINNLKVTAGIRVDYPFMMNDIDPNPTFTSSFLLRNDIKPSNILVSPRLGFNWDVMKDAKTQLRGGVGVFSGRPPFVWLSNQYSNTGVTFGNIQLQQNQINTIFNGLTQAERDQILTNPNYIPSQEFATKTSVVNITNPNLRLPQIFRANIGVDQRLPWDMVGTLEFMYSKTINDIYVRNINLAGVVDTLNNEGRLVYGSVPEQAKKIDPVNFTDVYVLENTNQGYQYAATAQLQKTTKNLFVNLAYNFSVAKDISSMSSSIAASNFQGNRISQDPNNPGLAFSNFDQRHRAIAAVGYTVNYSKYASTSISLFYTGQSGNRYSYVASSNSGVPIRDINNDGVRGNDLIFVPKDQSQIQFDGTPEQQQAQWDAFNAFIDKDEYLKTRRGTFAERNGSMAPWTHILDLRILQNLKYTIGSRTHTLQLTFDVFNFTNLLNKKWGRSYFTNGNILEAQKLDKDTGNMVYKFNPAYQPVNTSLSLGSVWQAQWGIRYIF